MLDIMRIEITLHLEISVHLYSSVRKRNYVYKFVNNPMKVTEVFYFYLLEMQENFDSDFRADASTVRNELMRRIQSHLGAG